MVNSIESRLKDLGIDLPDAPKPVASYVPAVRTGNLLVVSGQLAFEDGLLAHTGAVPSSTSVEDAITSARRCA
ncbi:MAG: RidA family protein, partial [Phycisphaera sp.]|nr:RidA family protein [Phycisphaera sp.]